MNSRIIIITHPGQVNDEINICKDLLNAGLEKLHVRKPNWGEEKLNQWFTQFSKEELNKLVIHHDTLLFEKFNLGGLHVSYSDHMPVLNKKESTLSCSVHSWDEAREAADKCDYLFISPIFDSISKNAYKKNKELTVIPEVLKKTKLFALGGIDESNISEVYDIGYFGAVLLGYIWNNPEDAVKNFKKLNKLIHA